MPFDEVAPHECYAAFDMGLRVLGACAAFLAVQLCIADIVHQSGNHDLRHFFVG